MEKIYVANIRVDLLGSGDSEGLLTDEYLKLITRPAHLKNPKQPDHLRLNSLALRNETGV